MKLILVVMFLSGRTFEPVYVQRFPTEQACTQESAKYPDSWNARKKAVCVAEITR